MKEFLAFIPARRGSKGVQNKNIRSLCGKPLIAYTIEAALKAGCLDVFVSTDDEVVVDIASTYGISCDYRRPDALASDVASMKDAVVDGLEFLNAKNQLPKYTVLMQPTSPFRTSADVNRLCEKLKETRYGEAVIGVSPLWHHPYESMRSKSDGSWTYLAVSELQVARRQDYVDQFYFINGSLYGFYAAAFLENKKFFDERAKLLVMDDINTLDIDTERDFMIAEALMNARMEKRI